MVYHIISKTENEIRNGITIGLFGTCDKSVWRNEFIDEYNIRKISHYNPQVADWQPECADIEAYHLAHDKIILFPVLSETDGLGSLSEIGFSIMNAIKLNTSAHFIILIDDKVDDSVGDENIRNKSNTNRALVKAHLKELDLSNVYLVDTLDEMLYVSLVLYNSENCKRDIMKYSLAAKAV